MPAEERPQLYLSTPSVIDLEAFPPVLARILDSFEIACVRLALSGREEFILGRAADALRQELDFVMNTRSWKVTAPLRQWKGRGSSR